MQRTNMMIALIFPKFKLRLRFVPPFKSDTIKHFIFSSKLGFYIYVTKNQLQCINRKD